MKEVRNIRISSMVRLFLMVILILTIALGTRQTVRAASGRAPVDLGAATSYVILSKTGVTNIPASNITGNIGASPIAASAITGFSLIADSTNTFSTSSQVTGKIYAANYASPTPAELTVAIGDMQTAYADAAGRSLPDFTELYAGNLSGKTLAPGLYKWGSGVLITSNVTLAGPADAVWIFQIAGNLTMGSGAKMLLSGGARSKNIFWQVAGGTGVEIGTTAHVEGTILAAKAIHLRTGASLNGRVLSQTAVTLAKNILVIPTPNQIAYFTSDGTLDGWVLESAENSNAGGIISSTATTLRLGDDALNKQYRSILHFNTSSLPDAAVITRATLKLMKQSQVGSNPFATHNGLRVDIRKPYFGTSAGLQMSDFQSGPNVGTGAVFGINPAGAWYTAVLTNTGKSFVNRTGTTQFRLGFVLDDNNDFGADYASFYSGNDATSTNRPRLIVEYYIP